MLTHQNSHPTPPVRVVVIGSGGFVGSTIVKELLAAGIATVGLSRKEVDLLDPRGPEHLKGRLLPTDAVVFVSAVAPAKNVSQMMTNLRMAEAAIGALAVVPPAHLLYISSDAVYADDANPVNERSPIAPSTTHGMMHAARELMFRSAYSGPAGFLRPTLIYGASDPHSGYGPNRFRRQAAKGEPISVFGEGEEKRRPRRGRGCRAPGPTHPHAPEHRSPQCRNRRCYLVSRHRPCGGCAVRAERPSAIRAAAGPSSAPPASVLRYHRLPQGVPRLSIRTPGRWSRARAPRGDACRYRPGGLKRRQPPRMRPLVGQLRARCGHQSSLDFSLGR